MSVQFDDIGKPATRGVGEWRSELVRHVAECASTSGDRGRGYFTSLITPRAVVSGGAVKRRTFCVLWAAPQRRREEGEE